MASQALAGAKADLTSIKNSGVQKVQKGWSGFQKLCTFGVLAATAAIAQVHTDWVGGAGDIAKDALNSGGKNLTEFTQNALSSAADSKSTPVATTKQSPTSTSTNQPTIIVGGIDTNKPVVQLSTSTNKAFALDAQKKTTSVATALIQDGSQFKLVANFDCSNKYATMFSDLPIKDCAQQTGMANKLVARL